MTLAMTTVHLAVPVLDQVKDLGKDLTTIMTGTVLAVLYLFSVAKVWGRTGSVLQTGVAAIGGAIVLGIVASQTVLSKGTQEQLDARVPAHSVVRAVDAGPGGRS